MAAIAEAVLMSCWIQTSLHKLGQLHQGPLGTASLGSSSSLELPKHLCSLL